MTERHPDLFKVLIGEIGQDGKANVVLGSAGPARPSFKPVGDLLQPPAPEWGAILKWADKLPKRK
jgi:hypothetical protein